MSTPIRFLLLLLVICCCSCTATRQVPASQAGTPVLMKSTRNSATYQYRVPSWMAWAQIEFLVRDLPLHQEIQAVTRPYKNHNILKITTLGLLDSYQLTQVLHREMAYLPGAALLDKTEAVLRVRDLDEEEAKYVEDHPELFQVTEEAGME